MDYGVSWRTLALALAKGGRAAGLDGQPEGNKQLTEALRSARVPLGFALTWMGCTSCDGGKRLIRAAEGGRTHASQFLGRQFALSGEDSEWLVNVWCSARRPPP
jgi:hypothetical protein